LGHAASALPEAAGRDGDASQELVQLLVVAHGKLHVARDNAHLLVVMGGVASETDLPPLDLPRPAAPLPALTDMVLM